MAKRARRPSSELELQCVALLEKQYVGLSFRVEIWNRWGDLRDIGVTVCGSSNALIRHKIVTRNDLATVGRSGMSYKPAGVWRLVRRAHDWKAESLKGDLYQALTHMLSRDVPNLESELARRKSPTFRNPPASALPTVEKTNGERCRPVGRYQRTVTWSVQGNLIELNWDRIRAQRILASMPD